MIEVSNSTEQTVQPNQSAVFDTNILKTGCDTSHRPNSGVVTLRAKCAVYEVHFSANISSTVAGAAQLAISLDGEPLPETTMVNTISTAGDPENAATSTLVRTDGCCRGRISVTNTGTNPVVISASPSLFVKRVC